jgi:outer membrane protein OmpA-like peptidoglycan-associated protein
MKIAYRLFLLLLISVFLFSCSEKKSGIEGKIVDGQGQPISGITVIFKQVQASKGYEQFETKTLANGVFRIDGVMPASEYIITPVSDTWKTKVTTKITTSTEGQILALGNPVVIRFKALKDRTVVDTRTGLQWLILGISDLNSSNVLISAKNIKEGGFTDWRLPTKTEVLQLQETPAAPVTQSETAAVSQKICCVWATELNSENVEWKFYVDDGNDVWASSNVPPDDRIVVVRNYNPAAPSTQTPTAVTSSAVTPAAVTPEAVSPAPSARLAAEKKPATEPAATLTKKKQIAAVEPSTAPVIKKKDIPAPAAVEPLPTPVIQKKDIPIVQSDDGVLRASRKACLANKGQPLKSTATKAPLVTASPAKESPAVEASTTKQSPAARVKLPVQPYKSIGNSITIQFDTNKSNISPEELSKLKAFYAKVKGKNGRFVIEGNSDGDATDNFKISGDRALSVKAMLHKLGLSKQADVKIAGLSDTKPIADSTTEEGRMLNRRAEISFVPGSSAAAAPSVAAPEAKQSPSVAAPAKQAPPVIVTTPPVKEDGVLKASRKACLAKKAQPAK